MGNKQGRQKNGLRIEYYILSNSIKTYCENEYAQINAGWKFPGIEIQ